MPENNEGRNYEERYLRREERRRQERLKRQKRNRMIIIGCAAAILIIIILILIFSIRGCSSCSGSTKPTDATQPTSATQAATQAATEPTSPAVKEIADNGKEGYFDDNSSLYFWDNKAFELFYGGESSAREYADAINRYKKSLGNNITVYDMVVPNHSEFGLCKREAQKVSDELGVSSQRENTSTIYGALSKDIKSVDIYNTINEHKTEYIYFNTDHHWTGLGAYYAYAAFAKSAGLTPLQISSAQKNSIDGFLGSLYTASEADVLEQNPDHVDYYTLPGNYSCKLFMQDSSEAIDVDMYYESAEPGSGTYGVFCWGDNPLMIIDNVDNTSGKKIAIVKESYGNAFAPYLSYNYDEVHIIDFRYFDGNLKDYCTENGISEVLFLNGIMSANTGVQISSMDSLFENSGSGSYDLNSSSSSDSDVQDDGSGDSGEADISSENDSTDEYADSDNAYDDSGENEDYSYDDGGDYSYDDGYSDDYSYDESYDSEAEY